MDLETENRIAAILLKEAAELRRQAQTEGALAYLRQPTVRSRPNSRFLTATVLGVQQANRVVEVNEMWRLREKQLELEDRIAGKKDESGSGRSYRESGCGLRRSPTTGSSEIDPNSIASHPSRKRIIQNLLPTEGEGGLRDDEVEEFLHTRIKRGRGAIGSRMDETGPYLPSCPDSNRTLSESSDEELTKKHRVLLGPEKPASLKYGESSYDESLEDMKRRKTCSNKQHSRKHKSEDSKDRKKKRREDKKRKHHKCRPL